LLALQSSYFTNIREKFEEKFGNRTIDKECDKDDAIKLAEQLFEEAINKSLAEIYEKLQELVKKNKILEYKVSGFYNLPPISIEDFGKNLSGE